MIDDVAACGANAFLANAGGIVAWYPSRLSFQRPNPYLRGDYLAEVIDAARAKGIRVLARLDITKGWADQLAAHPEWFRIGPNGEPVHVRELAETCFNGPYWQQFNFELLDEILSAYPVDGIFYNHYRYLTCYCGRCRETFRAATGHAMPAREDWDDAAWRALVGYRYQALADYTARVKAHAQRARPGALVAWDYEVATDNPAYARDSGWGPPLTTHADVILSIAFDRLTRPLPKWIYQHGEQASLGRSSFQKPTCVLITHTAIFGNRRTAQPPAQLTRDLVQIAAHGGAPGVQVMGTFEQDDRKALPALRATYQFLAANASTLGRARSAAEIAVVYSQMTADWYPRGDVLHRYLAHYRGCYEALAHEHLPFDVLEHTHLRERIRDYRVVILPNLACLDDETAAAVDAFVAGGGHVIVTHETGLYDAGGRHRGDFALTCIGRRFVKRRLMQGAYLLVGDRSLLGPSGKDTDLIGLGWERPYGGFGPFLPRVDVDDPGDEGEFIFTDDAGSPPALVDLRLTNPVTNNVPEFSYWEGEIGAPGLTVRRHGQGTAAYLPWPVGRLYHLYGVVECRRLVGALIDRALGPRPLVTDAPPSVETVVRADGARRIVYVINSTGIESKPLMDVVPVGPITVSVRGAHRTARALVAGSALSLSASGDGASFVLPRLGGFEVVVLE
jgi:hypothetical protein